MSSERGYQIPTEKRVIDRIGNETAAKLLPRIKSLEKDFYASHARFVAANLQDMEKGRAEHFKRDHPTVAGEIVTVFAWCYTFDFK